MTRAEALIQLRETDAEEISNEILLELEAAFQKNKKAWAEELAERFIKACWETAKKQTSGQAGAAGFITAAVLRSRIIEKNYNFPIYICDGSWWLDKNIQTVGSVNGEEVFVYYEKMEKLLETARKKYVGKTIAQDTQTVMRGMAEYFVRYLAKSARYGMAWIIESEEYKSVLKEEALEIHLGEYMDFTEVLYRDALGLTKAKGEVRENLRFEDLRGQDFRGLDMREADLQFANARDCNFRKTDLSYGVYMGTNFSGCNMEGTDFSYSYLYEADFSGANLRGAVFRNSEAWNGLPDPKVWDRAGYFEASFRDADLRDSDFTGADVRGADFRGAFLEGAKLTDEQKNSAVF